MTGPSPLSQSHPRTSLVSGLRGNRTLVCGIVNVTPDSLYGGRPEHARAIEHGLRLAEERADVIDVGGESSRPGAQPTSVGQELLRVVPVVEALSARVTVPLSVDTSRPEVMRAAVAAGADMINDVRALRRPGALAAVAELDVPVCLMHMRGEPRTMQVDPRYEDPVAEIRGFLAGRVNACLGEGIAAEHLVIDPGFGFGKTLAHNLVLLSTLPRFAELGTPVMVGLSRKSMLGELTGRAVADRLACSVAAALLAAQGGIRMLRVHDVAATRDALAVLEATRAAERHSARVGAGP